MVAEFLKTHEDLTYIELLHIQNEELALSLKYALRQERHPDNPEKKADEA